MLYNKLMKTVIATILLLITFSVQAEKFSAIFERTVRLTGVKKSNSFSCDKRCLFYLGDTQKVLTTSRKDLASFVKKVFKMNHFDKKGMYSVYLTLGKRKKKISFTLPTNHMSQLKFILV